MFHPLLIAAGGEPTPTWLAIVLGLGGGVVITAGSFLTALFSNRNQRTLKADDRDAEDRKASSAGRSAVEVERVKAEASERERLFKAWQDNESRYAQEVIAMRAEMAGMRKTFGHEVRNIHQYITTLQDLYHSLHNAASMLALQSRIMRARLKRQAEASGEKFDEEEFPPVEMAPYDPKYLPKFQPTSAWDEPGGGLGAGGASNEKRISGRVTLSPDDG